MTTASPEEFERPLATESIRPSPVAAPPSRPSAGTWTLWQFMANLALLATGTALGLCIPHAVASGILAALIGFFVMVRFGYE